MHKVFDYNADINKTAYMNWRVQQHQPLHNMLVIADGYSQSVILQIDACLADNHDKKADVVIFPVLFSMNHAIEVYLKVINWSLNILLEKDDKYCGGHDIRQIWNTVKSLVNVFEEEKDRKIQFKGMTEKLEEYIAELYQHIDGNINAHKKMKNMDFSRYPFNTDYHYHFYIETFENVVVDLEYLKELFEEISCNLSCIAGDYEEKATFVPEYE